MNRNYLLAVFILLFFNVTFSQQMPIDFSDNAGNFSVWGGSTFAIVPSPTDSNNSTGQFFRSSSTGEQGQYIDLTQPINLDEEDEITLKFYAFDPNQHTIFVKLENGTNPNIEVSVTTNSQNVWTDLTFDFSTVGGSGLYGRFVIRIDDGSNVPGTFLIDDINDGSIATDPNELDVIYDELVWSDEFDSTTPTNLDASKWYHQTIGPNGGQWFNGEQQHYTNRIDNSYIENGFLHIVAKKENFTQDGVALQYTSARLNSKFAFTYGRVDVRAKLPEGAGTWPAIWMLGKNINELGAYWQTEGFGTTSWPACGEIDIMEHGLGAVNHTSSAIHTPSSFGNTVNTDSQLISDGANNFHIYSVNWSPNQITFLVDGVGFYTYNPAVKDANTWPFDLEQYLLLNVAMGGVAGAIDPNFTESSMIIDYVRVYQEAPLSIEKEFVDEFTVFPNPASDYINIVSNKNITSLKLNNAIGQLVAQQNTQTNKLHVKSLKSGVYVLKITSENRTISKKVLID